MRSAVFTGVEGEDPKPTDSGNLFCRWARDELGIPDEKFVAPNIALDAAAQGGSVVFLDDFIGSGDQFTRTWTRPYRGTFPVTFEEAAATKPFVALYVALVAMKQGLESINQAAPSVAISVAHVLSEQSTIRGLLSHPSFPDADLPARISAFLTKYTPRLRPSNFMNNEKSWATYGYKDGGLMLAFEHSVPDATLPIFWCTGDADWVPLVKRA